VAARADLAQAAPVDLDRVARVVLDRGVAVAADRVGLLMVAPGTAGRRAMVRRIAAGVVRLDREARIPHAIAAPADLRPMEAARRTMIVLTLTAAAPMDLRVIEAIAALTVAPADNGPMVLLDSVGRAAPVVREVASDAGVDSAARVDLVVAAVRSAKFFRPRSSTN
jgi:hypothetical protein